jgi:hypothetical protein
LPADAKFFLSVVDYPTSRTLLEQTGLGQLLQDETMQPFLRDVPRQLRERASSSWLGLMWVDLGVPWERFSAVPGGEVAWVVYDVEGRPAAALMADVSGKEAELDRLREDMAAAMARRSAKVSRREIDGTTLTVYDIPQQGETPPTALAYFVRNGVLVASPHADLAQRMVSRVGVEQSDNLSGLAPYQHVLGECRKASGEDPHAALYLVPFDCLELMHRVAEEKKVDVEASPEVYRSQGFDALSAIGATIVFGGADTDFHFFASLYAPKPWSQSMRMLDLRNAALQLPAWVDNSLSSCSLLNLHAPSVYENLGPFFDEVVANGAEGAWNDILLALREDEDGPRLDLEREVLNHLSGPALVLESASLPVTRESPQVLLAIQSSDEAALRQGIQKAMQDDPLILKKKVGEITCYYSVSDDDAEALLWALCVAQGHLFMANDFDILEPLLLHKVEPPLAEDPAFQRARATWQQDLSAELSALSFYRLDRWWAVRHELLRAGEKVDPRKSLSGMLNAFLGGEPLEDEEPGLDGSQLPPFEKIRQYFGTFEAAVISVDSGWLASGQVRR